MTKDHLKRGIELIEIIDECAKFVKALESLDGKKDKEGRLTVSGTISMDTASIPISRYKNAVNALKNCMKEELKQFKQEFENL